MFPDEQMKSKLAHMHAKYQDGTVHTRDHLLRRPLLAPEDEIKHIYNSAGAGCFARPLEYCGIALAFPYVCGTDNMYRDFGNSVK